MRAWLDRWLDSLLVFALAVTVFGGLFCLIAPSYPADILGVPAERTTLTRLVGWFLVLFGLVYVPVRVDRRRHRSLLVLAAIEKLGAGIVLLVEVAAFGASGLFAAIGLLDLGLGLAFGLHLVLGEEGDPDAVPARA